jgi:hypothetical protein
MCVDQRERAVPLSCVCVCVHAYTHTMTMIAYEPWQIAYLATPAVGISNVPLHLLRCTREMIGIGCKFV